MADTAESSHRLARRGCAWLLCLGLVVVCSCDDSPSVVTNYRGGPFGSVAGPGIDAGSTATGGGTIVATDANADSQNTGQDSAVLDSGAAGAKGGAGGGAGAGGAAGKSGGTGGSAPATGGAAGTGGATVGTGGAVSTGGTISTGGALGTGGASGTGGAVSTGGASGTGGAVTTGGASGTGGSAVSTGGSTSTGGTLGSGGAGGGQSGSTGGAGGAGPNILANPNFDLDASSWSVDYGIIATWTGMKDVAASSLSGALGLANSPVADLDGTSGAGARQCVAAVSGTTYQLSGQIFIDPGQGAGSAGLELIFFATTDCTGTATGVFDSDLVTSPSTWKLVTGSTSAPDGTRSVAVRLVVTKKFRDPAFRAFFDALAFRGQS